MNQRFAALTAGIALLLMSLAALFSYGFVHGTLVVPGDAAATFRNIEGSIHLFRAAMFGWVVILVCDIVVAWAFYLLLKPANEGLSLLAAWFRLVYAALLGSGILMLALVSLLASRGVGASGLPADRLEAYVMLCLDAFDAARFHRLPDARLRERGRGRGPGSQCDDHGHGRYGRTASSVSRRRFGRGRRDAGSAGGKRRPRHIGRRRRTDDSRHVDRERDRFGQREHGALLKRGCRDRDARSTVRRQVEAPPGMPSKSSKARSRSTT